VREYIGPTSQITSAAFHSSCTENNSLAVFLVTGYDGTIWIFDGRKSGGPIRKMAASGSPPWTMNVRDEYD
jgi:hypothetical protein